jgi:adenylate cyclase
VELCELVWKSDPDETATTLTLPTKKLVMPVAGAITLVYRGTKAVRRRLRDSITLGRDDTCGMVVHEEQASRLHCTIERKHDKFVLVDHSTNGTYVTIEGNAEVLVQREEFALTQRGFISLGRPKSVTQEIVEFMCE